MDWNTLITPSSPFLHLHNLFSYTIFGSVLCDCSYYVIAELPVEHVAIINLLLKFNGSSEGIFIVELQLFKAKETTKTICGLLFMHWVNGTH